MHLVDSCVASPFDSSNDVCAIAFLDCTCVRARVAVCHFVESLLVPMVDQAIQATTAFVMLEINLMHERDNGIGTS